MSPLVSVLMCVAYDWRLVGRAVASVWDIAKEVLISWDAGGMTWSGHPFEPPSHFQVLDSIRAAVSGHGPFGRAGYTEIREKVRLFPGGYWAPGHERQELQIRQRLALAHLATPGHWQVTLDADEELLNPAAFVATLPALGGDVGATARFVSVYKVIGETALVFDSDRHFPIAMARPGVFIDGMSRAQNWLPTDGVILHHHMDRPEDELRLKLASLSPTSWSSDDMLTAWQETTLENYTEARPRPGTCYHPDTPLRAIPLPMLRSGLAPFSTAARRAL